MKKLASIAFVFLLTACGVQNIQRAQINEVEKSIGKEVVDDDYATRLQTIPKLSSETLCEAVMPLHVFDTLFVAMDNPVGEIRWKYQTFDFGHSIKRTDSASIAVGELNKRLQKVTTECKQEIYDEVKRTVNSIISPKRIELLERKESIDSKREEIIAQRKGKDLSQLTPKDFIISSKVPYSFSEDLALRDLKDEEYFLKKRLESKAETKMGIHLSNHGACGAQAVRQVCGDNFTTIETWERLKNFYADRDKYKDLKLNSMSFGGGSTIGGIRCNGNVIGNSMSISCF